MNNEIQQTREILQFLENGYDLDDTRQQPLLRSFRVRYGASYDQMKMEEHNMRIQYYQEKLYRLLNEETQELNKRVKLETQTDLE